MFFRAFWCFGQCVEAFSHCKPVLSIDGTFLTSKYKGTLLIAISIDAVNRLLPLAFALVEKENRGSSAWFLRLVRVHVVGPSRPLCVLSDRHAGILGAVIENIPGHGPVHHWWCMSDPGLRDCVHNVVHIGIGDRTCPISYLCYTLLACEVELVDTKGSYSSCTRVRFLSYCRTRIHVTLSSRIYKGGQGPPQNTSTPKAIQTTKRDIGYYAHRGPNLSKPCVACTFEFLISVTPYLKLTTSGIPLDGQAVKHR
jgi:hypothetical protein